MLLALTPAGIHSSPCGLSLWQREDGQLPAEEPGEGQRQDQGNCSKLFLYSCVQRRLKCMTRLKPFSCFCRTVTRRSIRRRSRDTHTSSTSCCITEHRPTNSPPSVHTDQWHYLHSSIQSMWSVLNQTYRLHSSRYEIAFSNRCTCGSEQQFWLPVSNQSLTSLISLFFCGAEWEQRSVHRQEARIHLCGRHAQSGDRGNSDHSGAYTCFSESVCCVNFFCLFYFLTSTKNIHSPWIQSRIMLETDRNLHFSKLLPGYYTTFLLEVPAAN